MNRSNALLDSLGTVPVFVYGTLRNPRTLKEAIGHVDSAAPADLPGFARTGTDRGFPDINPAGSSGASVVGKELLASGPDLAKLLRWEGSDGYQPEQVTLANGTQALAFSRHPSPLLAALLGGGG